MSFNKFVVRDLLSVEGNEEGRCWNRCEERKSSAKERFVRRAPVSFGVGGAGSRMSFSSARDDV